MANNDFYSVVHRFRELNTDGQKSFLKEIFVDGYFGAYVDIKVKEYRKRCMEEGDYIPNRGEVEEYRETIQNRVDGVFDSLLEALNSNDEQLKSELFEKFLENYKDIIALSKIKICGTDHDFTEWKEKEGTIPVFSNGGSVEGYTLGRYFERKCYYCGTVEKEYDPSKLRNVKKLTNNNNKPNNEE